MMSTWPAGFTWAVCRAVPEYATTVDAQARQIATVIALHIPRRITETYRVCTVCRDQYGSGESYPCRTARALGVTDA